MFVNGESVQRPARTSLPLNKFEIARVVIEHNRQLGFMSSSREHCATRLTSMTHTNVTEIGQRSEEDLKSGVVQGRVERIVNGHILEVVDLQKQQCERGR